MNHKPRTKVLVISLLLTLFATFLVARSGRSQTPETQAMPATDNSRYRLSGPYTQKNLTIFLIHGKVQMAGKNFLILQEAHALKKVIVYETNAVNELVHRNVSDQDDYI